MLLPSMRRGAPTITSVPPSGHFVISTSPKDPAWKCSPSLPVKMCIRDRVSAVRPHRHVRCIQTHIAVRIQRILRFPVNHSFITPIPQIIRRSGPAYIIIQTVCMAAETVMGAVNIDSVIKYIRFSVRDIFPGRKIRIICLFFHTFAVPSLPKPG